MPKVKRHWAKVRLYPGMQIPHFFQVVGAVHRLEEDESWVILSHPGIRENYEGEVPIRFWTIENLLASMDLSEFKQI